MDRADTTTLGLVSVLSILWGAWVVSWLLAARWTTTTVASQSPSARLVQSVPIWIGAILLFRPFGGLLGMPLIQPSRLTATIALVLAALGFAFTWWARIHLGRFWSGRVTLKSDHMLIRSGPYARTRHPIYTGLLVAFMATALDRGTIGGVLGVACALSGLVLKLRQEEQFLTRKFGTVYDDYKKAVPALIPKLW